MFKNKIKIGCSILKSGSYKKITNLFQNIYSVYGEPIEIRSSPLIIQVEPTTYCNLECIMCLSPALGRGRMNMSAKQFSNLLTRFEYTEKISLVGVGEPLLNPELPEFIRLAKKRNIQIGIATNGILLNGELAKRLLDSGIDWINISIDGANSETYKRIRGSDKFDTVIKNAENLQHLIANYKNVESGIWFTIQKENVNELPQMVSLIKSVGYRKLYSQTTHTWGNPDWAKKKGYVLNGNLTELFNSISITEKLSRQYNIDYFPLNVPNPPIEAFEGRYNGRRSCKWPWRSCYITVEGFVTPCCMNGCDPNVINFGSIYDLSFEQIWNSPAYQKFRKRLKSAAPPEICIGCPSF